MDVIYPQCCGLDVHKKTIAACLITSTAGAEPMKEIRTFGTMTADLLALADWLQEAGCTHVAMESTGVYWRPVYNLLEGQFALLVVNAQHIKAVPGRKTDVKDAAWIAELLRHGLLRGSFIPSKSQRQLRGPDALSQYARPGARSDAQSIASRLGGREPEARVRGHGYLWRLGAGHVGGDPRWRT
jgi:transposase